MSAASCEIDAKTAARGTPMGLLGWGAHVVQQVGFDAPMPPKVVEEWSCYTRYPFRSSTPVS
jgi:hypothetical protein